jgi:hypothetical protein
MREVNRFAEIPCPVQRLGAQTGRLKADPETGVVKGSDYKDYFASIGVTWGLRQILPAVLRFANIQNEYRDSVPTWQFVMTAIKEVFSFGKDGSLYLLKGGLADGRGALGNGERANQFDELESFAKKNGGAVGGEVRITEETFAAWQEHHFAEIDKAAQEPIPESDKRTRRIELTLPFFLFPRTDSSFAGGKPYVTMTDVRKFWDPNNPDFPPDFDSLKRDLSVLGLLKAASARMKRNGAPESAQKAIAGEAVTGPVRRSIAKAVERD